MIDGVWGVSIMQVGGLAGQTASQPNAGGGETGVLWVDLSAAGLIDGNFVSAKEGGFPLKPIPSKYGPIVPKGGLLPLSQYLPPAKIGSGNSVYVLEINKVNYFGIANVADPYGMISAHASMTVAQAYAIDQKIDDGLPTTGSVAAMISDNGAINWAMGGPAGTSSAYVPSGSLFSGIVGTAGDAPSATTCFDAATGTQPTYSLEQNNGSGPNCALIIAFQ